LTGWGRPLSTFFGYTIEHGFLLGGHRRHLFVRSPMRDILAEGLEPAEVIERQRQAIIDFDDGRLPGADRRGTRAAATRQG
jgi:hypothetical protein